MADTGTGTTGHDDSVGISSINRLYAKGSFQRCLQALGGQQDGGEDGWTASRAAGTSGDPGGSFHCGVPGLGLQSPPRRSATAIKALGQEPAAG